MTGLYQKMGMTVIMLAVSMAGCTLGAGEPVESITSAELVIKVAKDNNAAVNAPLELKLAEEKLGAARIAVQKEDFLQAKRLAEEALVDAKLAETKSLSVKARKQTEEMRGAIETLRQEIERAQKQK